MAGRHPKIQIDFDKIYESNSCGPFKIIKDLGRNERSRLFVRIKFLNTGTEKDIRYDIAMDGKVIDDLYGIDFNHVYNSIYYGPYKIIKYIGRNDESKKVVRIKFLNTGYEYNVLLRVAKSGEVRDYTVCRENRIFTPSSAEEHENYIRRILYGRWHSMMDRCYNPYNISYDSYGAKGVTVCELWHDVNRFIESVKTVQNYDKFYNNPDKYHLDKDLLQSSIPANKKIYSPQTCIFLSYVDNDNLAIKNNPNMGYYGIEHLKDGNYLVRFSIDGLKYEFGVYSNLTAALNEYNYYYSRYAKYDTVPLFNENIEFMSHEEAQKYLVRLKASTK